MQSWNDLYKICKQNVYFTPTVSSCTWRPAREVLVCGSEDRSETAGPFGAARWTRLPPANDCYTEGLRSVRERTSRTSLTLLVLISGTTCRKDFALEPLYTWGQGYKSLCNKKETINLSSFAILSVCVREFVISESIFAPGMWTWDWCFEVTGGRQWTSTVQVVIFVSEW